MKLSYLKTIAIFLGLLSIQALFAQSEDQDAGYRLQAAGCSSQQIEGNAINEGEYNSPNCYMMMNPSAVSEGTEALGVLGEKAMIIGVRGNVAGEVACASSPSSNQVLRLRGGGRKPQKSEPTGGPKHTGDSDEEESDLDHAEPDLASEDTAAFATLRSAGIKNSSVNEFLLNEIRNNIYTQCAADVAALILDRSITIKNFANTEEREAAEKIAKNKKESALEKKRDTVVAANRTIESARQLEKKAITAKEKVESTDNIQLIIEASQAAADAARAAMEAIVEQFAQKIAMARVDLVDTLYETTIARSSAQSEAAKINLESAKAFASSVDKAFEAVQVAENEVELDQAGRIAKLNLTENIRVFMKWSKEHDEFQKIVEAGKVVKEAKEEAFKAVGKQTPSEDSLFLQVSNQIGVSGCDVVNVEVDKKDAIREIKLEANKTTKTTVKVADWEMYAAAEIYWASDVAQSDFIAAQVGSRQKHEQERRAAWVDSVKDILTEDAMIQASRAKREALENRYASDVAAARYAPNGVDHKPQWKLPSKETIVVIGGEKVAARAAAARDDDAWAVDALAAAEDEFMASERCAAAYAAWDAELAARDETKRSIARTAELASLRTIALQDAERKEAEAKTALDTAAKNTADRKAKMTRVAETDNKTSENNIYCIIQ